MAGGSSSSSTSTPTDETPAAFKALQQPLANTIASLLGYSSTGTTSGTTGTTTSGSSTGTVSGGQNDSTKTVTSNVPNTVWDATTQTFVPATTSNSSSGTTGTTGTSYTSNSTGTDASSVLSGIPTYTGATTAALTDNESSLLSQIMDAVSSGTDSTNSALSALSGIINGTSNQVSTNTSAQQIDSSSLANVLAQMIDTGSGSGITSSFNADDSGTTSSGSTTNDLLNSYITASQRATMDNLAQTLADNGSTFVKNGQFIQPTGSSAFDRAQALATQSAANAASDIAASIGYQGYQQDQTLNQETAAQNAANILSALQSNQSTALSAGTTNANNALSAAQSNQSADLAAQEANQTAQNENAQNATSAATAAGTLSSSEISNLTSALSSEALPRLIEQYGLDEGVTQFNNQMNDLLTLLQTSAGVTSPVIANTTSSDSSSKGSLSSLL